MAYFGPLTFGAAALCLWAAAADATSYTYVVTGSVDAANSFDDEQLFGDLSAARFIATFVVDDSVPTAAYHYDASGSRADGGGGFLAGTTPPLTATLEINGFAYTVPQGDAVQTPPVDPTTGDATGVSSTEQDQGSVVKDAGARSLSLGATYSDDYSCCGTFGLYGGESTRGLSFDLSAFDLADPDFRQLGTFALSDSGGFFFDTARYEDRQSSSRNFSNVTLIADTLSVTAAGVPEPAGWAAMTLGFAAIGLSARRRRASAAIA